MKPGSVLVDLAVERGGNCPLTERGQVVEKHGVTLVGLNNLPGMVATDASALYARNLQDFLKLISNADGALQIQRDDEIVAACLVCEGGNVTRGGPRHGSDQPHPDESHHLRAGHLCRLPRGLERHPALHTPLMAVTNAISAIIIVGAMLAAALTEGGLARGMGVFAVALAAVNVFGGFLVTRRMLECSRRRTGSRAREDAQ